MLLLLLFALVLAGDITPWRTELRGDRDGVGDITACEGDVGLLPRLSMISVLYLSVLVLLLNASFGLSVQLQPSAINILCANFSLRDAADHTYVFTIQNSMTIHPPPTTQRAHSTSTSDYQEHAAFNDAIAHSNVSSAPPEICPLLSATIALGRSLSVYL